MQFLRDQLRLTGTHWGCDTSNCGACTVLIDGEPRRACLTAVGVIEGAEVTTVRQESSLLKRFFSSRTVPHGAQ